MTLLDAELEPAVAIFNAACLVEEQNMFWRTYDAVMLITGYKTPPELRAVETQHAIVRRRVVF